MLVLGELGVNLAPLLASAGIAGIALGFGAQNLVKDFIAGLFMLLEDQYGVGDVVDLGEASGTVEAVGLRITTIRDGRGVLWYIRNGEIVRVGNKSQGWALVVVDVPVGFAGVEEAAAVLRAAADGAGRGPGVRRRPARAARGARASSRSPWTARCVRTTAKTAVRGAVAGRPRAAPAADRGAGERPGITAQITAAADLHPAGPPTPRRRHGHRPGRSDLSASSGYPRDTFADLAVSLRASPPGRGRASGG